MINNETIFEHQVNSNRKLFDYLKEELVLSLRQTNSLIKSKNMWVNGQIVKKNIDLKVNDIIRILFEDESNDYEKEPIPLEILYESIDLLIINKPPHMVVHPTNNIKNHTIANAVAYYFEEIDLKRKIRFVNRLDMDTSGILVIAKNAYSHQFLAKQFDSERITKKYLAVIDGHLKEKSGVILGDIRKEDAIYTVSEEGKKSKTIYKVIEEYKDHSLVECILKSGRTHQIRLHLKEIGGYILGDTLYHRESEKIKRQALHAYELSFVEPRRQKLITIQCELPYDMKKILI